jgi:hypothetical protein
MAQITSGAAIGGVPNWSSAGFGLASSNPISMIVNSLTPVPSQAPTVPSPLLQ